MENDSLSETWPEDTPEYIRDLEIRAAAIRTQTRRVGFGIERFSRAGLESLSGFPEYNESYAGVEEKLIASFRCLAEDLIDEMHPWMAGLPLALLDLNRAMKHAIESVRKFGVNTDH